MDLKHYNEYKIIFRNKTPQTIFVILFVIFFANLLQNTVWYTWILLKFKKRWNDQQRVMIICSKFDCSKNLLNTILLLLDTIRAIIIFLVNCSNPVNLWESTGFEQFNFLSKKYQLFENQMVDKGGGKCQLLDTIYSKENGLHVRQFG